MAITVGSVSVDVIPNAAGIYQRLRDGLVPAATRAGDDAGAAAGRAFGPAMAGGVSGSVADAVGQRIGQQIGQRIAAQVRGSLADGIRLGGRQATPSATRAGDDTGGAFGRAVKARLEAAFRSLPKIGVGLADTGLDADLDRLRARLETLSGARIGIDVDAATADAQIADIQTRLSAIAAQHPNVAIRADAATALAQLAAVRAEIDRVSGGATVRLETDGSFGARLRAAVAAAQASLPDIEVTASTDAARAELTDLRARLATLADARIGIDVSSDAALARIASVRADLDRLSSSSASVDVRVDAAAALAQLATVRAAIADLDGESVSPAAESFGALTTAAAAFGPALIPVLPVVAAGLGGIAAAAVAAGAGLGGIALVAVPAIKQVAAVLQLQKQAQTEAASATSSAGNGARQAAQQALQMAGAQQALATAERNGARQIASAQQQVGQARAQVAQATQQAAQATAQAAQQTAQAERSLAQAQQAALQAQQALTEARKEAAEQLQDLGNQLVDSQLSQRQAVLAVQDAQTQLTADRAAGSKVSAEQLAKDQLAYDQAVQSLKEQQLQTSRLTAQKSAADKAGVNGSAQVTQAQQAIVQAQQDVQDKTTALAQAQAAQKTAAVQGAQQVAQAQGQVVQAQAQVVQAQQSAADSITSAQRQIQSAQLSTTASAATGVTAQQKYAAALAGLSPSARTMMTAFVNLRTAFGNWSTALQPTVLPLFTRALNGVVQILPHLTGIVHQAAGAVGDLEDRFSRQIKSPFWSRLVHDVQTEVRPAIVGIGVALGDVFAGGAGIVDAFLPHINGALGAVDKATGKFASFGKNLKGSPAFASFLGYVRTNAPILGSLVAKVGAALVRVVVALSPMAGTATSFLNAIATAVSAIPVPVLTAVGVTFASIAIGAKLAAGAIAIWNGITKTAGVITGLFTTETEGLDAAMDANPIGLIITVIAALVVALIYAYQHWTGFREVVQAAWHGIQVAALFVWNNVLKPTFAAIVVVVQAVATAALWLWKNVLVPAFNGISLVARILFAVFVVAVFTPIVIAVRLAGAVIGWLWSKVIKPVFGWIGSLASWLWAKAIKPQLAAIVTAVKAVGAAGQWLWKTALSPAFHAIGGAAGWLYGTAIKPAFNAIAGAADFLWNHGLKQSFNAVKSAVGEVGDAFQSAAKFIAKVWGKVVDVTKTPVNFVISQVYTHGIKAVWDKVAGFVHLPKLPNAPKLLAAGGTVGAGWGAATPGIYNRPTAIVGEGRSQYPEYVIPTDPRYRARALALHRAAGTKLMASGGILGGLEDTLSGAARTLTSAAKSAWSGVTSATDVIAHPSQVWAKVTSPVRDAINSIGTYPMAKVIEGIPIKALSGLKSDLLNAIGLGGSGGSIGGAIPSGQHRVIISQALAAAKVPPPGTMAQWLTGMNTLIGRESGWNPQAINNWDSNAKAGHPSQGLTQTIPGTWAHYVPASLRAKGILDPVGNVAASVRYIVSRYGNITNVQQANASLPPKGYDSGGYLQPGLNLAYNGTGRPEPVFTTGQANALMSLAGSRGTDGGRRGDLIYNATVRETASRQSVLDALSTYDALHRSTVTGV